MASVNIRGQVSGAGPARARASAGDKVAEAKIEDGLFELTLEIPAGARAPASGELERHLPELFAFLGDGVEAGALVAELGGLLPPGAPARDALALHALAQSDDFLEYAGASSELEAWRGAKVELLSYTRRPVVERAIHVSDALDGHTVAVDFELPTETRGAESLRYATTADFETKLAELLAACGAGAIDDNGVEKLLCKIGRGGKGDLRHAFAPGDWLPHPHGKFPHRYGVVGRARLVPAQGHPFSGVFASGAVGIVRLGSAIHSAKFHIPGLALKLPVTGAESLDIAALYRAEGQGADPDFFRHTLHTRVPRPVSPKNAGLVDAVLLEKLQRGLEARSTDVLADEKRRGGPRRLPLEHLASMSQDGTCAAERVAPYELDFVPSRAVREAFVPPKPGELRLREQLEELPSPLVLYHVRGFERDELRGDECWEIGDLVLETPLKRSMGGDLYLHFRHYYPQDGP